MRQCDHSVNNVYIHAGFWSFLHVCHNSGVKNDFCLLIRLLLGIAIEIQASQFPTPLFIHSLSLLFFFYHC